jgi:hypothetical protein
MRVREVLIANFLLQESEKLEEKQRLLGKEPKRQKLASQGKAIHPMHKLTPVHIQLPRLLLNEPMIC